MDRDKNEKFEELKEKGDVTKANHREITYE